MHSELNIKKIDFYHNSGISSGNIILLKNMRSKVLDGPELL